MHPSLVPQHPDRWARANAGHANDEDGAPFAPLAGYAVRIRAGAGFASHHWDWYDPPYWIGGVFLVLSRRSPVPAAVRSRSPASPATCCPAGTGAPTCSHACRLVNVAPGSILHVSGSRDRQPSAGCAFPMASRRGKRTEAGQ